jgi:hypothetical protein
MTKISNKMVKEAITKHLPGRTVHKIINKGKWIKHNYQIVLDNGDVIFLKLKVHPEWGDLKHEVKVVELLNENAISVPRVLAIDYSCSILPYPFLIQEGGEGIRLGMLLEKESEDEIIKIYKALGQFYRKMHSIHFHTSGLWSDNPGEILYPVSPNDFMFNAEIVNGSGKKALEEGLISENTYKRAVSLWSRNLSYLKDHQPSLVHVSPFLWSIYLSKKENIWYVTKVTALGDIMWWDAAYDLALLQYPPFGNYVSTRWEAFLQEYGSIPERKRVLLYSILHRLCAVMGVYMEPETKGNERWKLECIRGLDALMDEIESIS